MAERAMSRATAERVLNAWAQGATGTDIADRFGTTWEAVRVEIRRAREHGDPRAAAHYPGARSTWPDEDIATLKRLWAEGKTAAVIAKAIGNGVTRNAVIGKVFRLDLQRRRRRFSHAAKPRQIEGQQKPTTRLRFVRPKPVGASPKAEAKVVVFPNPPSPQARPTTFLELNSSTCCHWVIGNEGQGPNTLMCGAPQQRHNPLWAGPYCAFHSGLAIRGTKGGDAATTIKQQQNHPLKKAGADGGEQNLSASGSFAEVPFR